MSFLKFPQKLSGIVAGYSFLCLTLVILLAFTFRISSAVPVLRKQVPWFAFWPMHDLQCDRVSINLDSKPGEYGELDYDFRTTQLETRFSQNRPTLSGDKDEQFVVERTRSKMSFSEGLKLSIQRELVPMIWLAKELDERGGVKSSSQFSMGTNLGYEPLVLSKKFAVTIDHDQVRVVDLTSDVKAVKCFPIPSGEKEFVGQIKIGKNRFGRVRKVGARHELDLYEVNSEGEVSSINCWPIGAKPAFDPPGTKGVHYSHFFVSNYQNRVYYPSASGNEIEVRAENGEFISSFAVPGLDLATGNWDWHGNFICWEEKKGELSYFDIEKHVELNIPTSVVAAAFGKTNIQVGNNDLMLLPGFIDSTTLVPQLLVASRLTGQVVKQWPNRPFRICTLIESGDQTQLLESGYEWGLSFVKREILDGTVIEAHYPLRQWLLWIGLSAFAIVAWTVAWLFYSARSGGIAWIDIAFVSGVLLAAAVWRLYSSGQPYSSSRLPYEYGGGIFAGVMSVVCMQVAGANKSIVNTTTPICIVIALGHLLVANLLNERLYNRGPGDLTWTTIQGPDNLHTAMSIIATMTCMNLLACFFLTAVGCRLRSVATRDETTQGKSFQFSIREFLWIIVLVALVSQPLSISRLSFRTFYQRVPWPDIIGISSMATLAIVLSLALALSKYKRANDVGWILTALLLATLLSEFLVDFASGQPTMLPLWRIVRAVMTASATTFVFASRFRSTKYWTVEMREHGPLLLCTPGGFTPTDDKADRSIRWRTLHLD